MHEKNHLDVLLVEDDEDDYLLILDSLEDIEETDFQLSWVQCSADALAALQEQTYDLCLFDYHIGAESGLDLLQAVLANGWQVPVIMLTGQDNRRTDLAAMEAGAADYLIKGQFSTTTLERSIRYAIKQASISSALRKSEERYALAAQGSHDGLWDWDLLGDSIYYSPRWKAILGYDDSQICDRIEEWFKRIHPEDRERFHSALREHLEGNTPLFQLEYRLHHQSDTYRWCLSRGLAVRKPNGAAYRMAGSLTDMSSHRILYDELTGLPNRQLFIEQLERALHRTRQHRDCRIAVLFLDFDRFKSVNDSLGHQIGDRLLIAISQRLQELLRPTDVLARLGGDEYAILVDDADINIGTATKVAKRINQALQQPFVIDGHPIRITTSIGIAWNSSDSCGAADLLNNADTAMYRSKEQGKNRFALFDREMHEESKRQLQLEADLRNAIEQNEFHLLYQPIVSIATGKVVSFEALIRWQHPTRGSISPMEFIPFAEDNGLIIPIGRWVLQEACRQLRNWQQQFPAYQFLEISVNLSRKQFNQPNLVEWVNRTLNQTELPAHHLNLEITETTIADNAGSAAEILGQLKSLGIQIHIDDFGTGYSSLSCLHTFPIDVLKIDRSFVRQMRTQGRECIVQTIISLARNLGMDAIAEGVESIDELELLKTLGCNFAQGYFFERPISSEQVRDLLSISNNTIDPIHSSSSAKPENLAHQDPPHQRLMQANG